MSIVREVRADVAEPVKTVARVSRDVLDGLVHSVRGLGKAKFDFHLIVTDRPHPSGADRIDVG